MKLAYSTWGMPTVPVDTAVRHVAELGYDGIELTVIPGYSTDLKTLDAAERKRILRLVADHGLALPAITANAAILALEPEVYARNEAQLKGSLDLAAEWALDEGPPAISTTAGGKAEHWETHKSLLIDRLGNLVEYAKSRGVIFGLEPHVSTAVNSPGRMLHLLEVIDSPFLKVSFDISHFDVQGLTIEETVPVLAPHAVHAQVKDQRGIVPDFEFLIPGEGDFDFVTYLKAMQAHGYKGYIAPEVSVMVQRRPNYDPMAAAELSYKTLARAFEEAGIDR